MKINIQELPPGTHLYRCEVRHETHSGPGLAKCPVEIWTGSGKKPVFSERCDRPVAEVDRYAEAIAAIEEARP